MACIVQMARPEQLDRLIDEDALQRAREKRRKVDSGVSEKVSITKRMYDALDTCIKNIGELRHFLFGAGLLRVPWQSQEDIWFIVVA